MKFDLSINSKILKKETKITMLMPRNRKTGAMKTLWLLHGGGGDNNEWCDSTDIEKHAQERNLCVIMPSVGDSFYADMKSGGKYFTYLTQELPQAMHNLYKISQKPEDNFVAGSSMGGYGAFKIALNYPGKYGRVAAFGGSMDLMAMYQYTIDHDEGTMKLFQKVYGDMSSFENSENDLFYLALKRKEELRLPKLYMCCGTDDFLFHLSKSYSYFLRENEIEFIYDEDIGGTHGYDYWNSKIKNVLDWLYA